MFCCVNNKDKISSKGILKYAPRNFRMGPFREGEIILKEKAFIHALDPKVIGFYCGCCLQITRRELLKCPGCSKFLYCEDCEPTVRFEHSAFECVFYRNYADQTSPNFHRIHMGYYLRIFHKLIYTPRKFGYFPKSSRKCQIELNEDLKEAINAILFLDCCNGAKFKLRRKEFIDAIATCNQNCLPITDDNFEIIGKGVFLGPFKFKSSDSNAAVVFQGPNLVMRAMSNISGRFFHTIYLSKIDKMPKAKRVSYLAQNRCNQNKCEDKDFIFASLLENKVREHVAIANRESLSQSTWANIVNLYAQLYRAKKKIWPSKYHPELTCLLFDLLQTHERADMHVPRDLLIRLHRIVQITHGDHPLTRRIEQTYPIPGPSWETFVSETSDDRAS